MHRLFKGDNYMEIRTIQNKKEYKAALDEIQQLWSAPAKSTEADRLDVLSLLVEHYEKNHFPIADPDPIEFIEHVMESRGLSRKDLEPMIGPRGRVADIMNKTRPLTLEMIRRLVAQLNLPADVLVKPYRLREALWAA
jgi:HTH-type transcriptional regulator/antitoxin HigA